MHVLRLAAAVLLTAALPLLSACSGAPERPDEVGACADKSSAACAAAREGFQAVNYPGVAPGRLLAAASRALGDLGFELERRDDAAGAAEGRYLEQLAVHDKQLDALFRKAIKGYAAAGLRAQIAVTAGPRQGSALRLRLFAALGEGGAGAAPAEVDSVAPYQTFFRAVGVELGASYTEPPPERSQKPALPIYP